MFGAIHQPNFLPWLGFFHKIACVQGFIFLDNVPSPQGKSWLSRNRINLNGNESWLTVPIRKSGRSGQLIKDVEIANNQPWVRKHLRTLAQAYHRAPFYETIMPQIEEVYDQQHGRLVELNVALITEVANILDLDCQFYHASDRVHGRWTKTEMIIHVCEAFGCQRYLTGLGGSLSFLEPELFHAAGIELLFQNFRHPTYDHPSGAFLENMNILDALFCMGPHRIQQDLAQQKMSFSSREEI